MDYTGIGGFEAIAILFPLFAIVVVFTIFFGILYFVVREAVASGIRRAREHAATTTPDA